MNRAISCFICMLLLFSVVTYAQTKPGPAGHWEGTLTASVGTFKVVLDLDKDAKGVWVGDIDIPDQGVRDIALRAVTVTDDSVSFELPPDSVGPKFVGKLSADGTTLAGELSQGGNNTPLSLKRTGEAKVYVQPKNASLPEKFAGRWVGSFDAMGTTLRLAFNLGNKDDAANGTIDSLDQNAMGIPMDSISVAENVIKISVRVIQGGYSGKLSEDGKTLTGEWTQMGNTLPLVLKKAAASK